jgi:NTP pyrophosphatase (non-canonical NTP hydrolase)
LLDQPQEELPLTLRAYQTSANETNVIAEKPVTLLLLGLFGEIGSLVSELKKQQRDEEAYIGFKASVVEELGDVLWYFACLSTHVNLSLESLARIAFRNQISTTEGDITFASIQENAISSIPTTFHLEVTLLKLSSEVGKLMTEFLQSTTLDQKRVSLHLAEVFKALVQSAIQAQVSLASAANRNLKKVFDRWPVKKEYPDYFDSGDEPDEQIPRHIEISIIEKTVGGRTYVNQKCNSLNIGDRLTDNKLEEDDYRFHDVFHLSYAAVLGWSPVTRALFKVKRKSIPKIDENEDGARAIITEEAISAWIFNHAAQLNYFENLKALDYGLLKAVRSLSKGYEVQTCPLWLWEEAILQGYVVFRQLRSHRRGLVIADMHNRTLQFQEIQNDPH